MFGLIHASLYIFISQRFAGPQTKIIQFIVLVYNWLYIMYQHNTDVTQVCKQCHWWAGSDPEYSFCICDVLLLKKLNGEEYRFYLEILKISPLFSKRIILRTLWTIIVILI